MTQLCNLCVFLAFACLAACSSREHMSDNYGRQSRTMFDRQHVSVNAAQGSPGGLDSEESHLIQSSYKESFGGAKRSEPDAASRVMLLREPSNVSPRR